jgi:hypothetical protein
VRIGDLFWSPRSVRGIESSGVQSKLQAPSVQPEVEESRQPKVEDSRQSEIEESRQPEVEESRQPKVEGPDRKWLGGRR